MINDEKTCELVRVANRHFFIINYIEMYSNFAKKKLEKKRSGDLKISYLVQFYSIHD